MKKPIITTIVVIILFVIALGVYFIPVIKEKNQTKTIEKIKGDSNAFTTKVLEEFSSHPTLKASEIAQKVCDELNQVAINPYDKTAKAYTFEKDCKGCNSVDFDDKLIMVTISTFDKEGKLMARTVIKPPSFVTYTKDNE